MALVPDLAGLLLGAGAAAVLGTSLGGMTDLFVGAGASAIQDVFGRHQAQYENPEIHGECEGLLCTLSELVAQLQQRMQKNKASRARPALEQLDSHLQKAAVDLEDLLNDRRWWRQNNLVGAPYVRQKLEDLKTSISRMFQSTMFIANLNMSLDTSDKIDNLSTWLSGVMLDIQTQQQELKKALDARISELREGPGKQFHQVTRQEAEAAREAVECEDITMVKFFNDVLALVAPLTDTSGQQQQQQQGSSPPAAPGSAPSPSSELLKDPITMELMSDPVVCSDGYTYDRFTVFKLNPRLSPTTRQPLNILAPNQALLSRLPVEQDQRRTALRQHYKQQALELAEVLLGPSTGSTEEQHAAAQAAGCGALAPHLYRDGLQQLQDVLEWDAADAECVHATLRLRQHISLQAQRLKLEQQQQEQQEEGPAVGATKGTGTKHGVGGPAGLQGFYTSSGSNSNSSSGHSTSQGEPLGPHHHQQQQGGPGAGQCSTGWVIPAADVADEDSDEDEFLDAESDEGGESSSSCCYSCRDAAGVQGEAPEDAAALRSCSTSRSVQDMQCRGWKARAGTGVLPGSSSSRGDAAQAGRDKLEPTPEPRSGGGGLGQAGMGPEAHIGGSRVQGMWRSTGPSRGCGTSGPELPPTLLLSRRGAAPAGGQAAGKRNSHSDNSNNTLPLGYGSGGLSSRKSCSGCCCQASMSSRYGSSSLSGNKVGCTISSSRSGKKGSSRDVKGAAGVKAAFHRVAYMFTFDPVKL